MVVVGFLLWSIFLFTPVYSINFNATVSLDGTGDYLAVGAAIASAPSHLNSRFYIRVKSGIYHERVEVPIDKTFIALIGDNPLTTIITDHRSNGSGFKTSNSATLTINGDNFMAQSLSFENSAGPQNGQAVAALDEAHRTSYYKCRFLSYQDTLYVNGQYQFFKECDVYGTIDFIFGHGAVLLQDSNIYARMPNQMVTLIAQSKEKANLISGFSFQNYTITTSPEISSNKTNVHVYLGRPWREYSTVVFMESYMGSLVLPEGWSEWVGIPLNHLFYGEFNNRGCGADIRKRVNWTNFHVMNRKLALQFTVNNFIKGSEWLPETGIPFRGGLVS